MYSLFSKSVEPSDDYREKKRFLKARGIALWDVLKECERPRNSADTNIKHEQQNDIASFLNKRKSIKAVFFNGVKASEYYNKYFGTKILRKKIIQLPSTSPANTMRFQKKLKQWAVIKDFAVK
jgi:TDG/mug DNA glycosylase family protein